MHTHSHTYMHICMHTHAHVYMQIHSVKEERALIEKRNKLSKKGE